MKISKQKAIEQNWDQVKSRNYKLAHLDNYQSVVFAELNGDPGEVTTDDLERVYYIVEGKGEFNFNGDVTPVSQG